MKFFIFIITLFLIEQYITGQNQNILLNASTHNTSGQYCGFWFFDNGGASANYANNIDYWITFLGGAAPNTHVRLNFAQFDIKPDDTLYIYDGPNISSPLLSKHNNNYNPLTGSNTLVMATLNNASGALTVRFKSNSSNNAAGWKATVICAQACQQITPQINFSLTQPTPHQESDGYYYIDICAGQTITFAALGGGPSVFPQNDMFYHQDSTNCTFHWNFGDNTTATGQIVTHTYSAISGYNVYLSITDNNGCVSTQQFHIRVRISGEHIVTVNPPPPMCTGDTIMLNAWNDPNSIVVTTSSLATIETEMFNQLTHIPDGPNCPTQCYGTPVTFNSFPAGATIQSAQDIASICINMEHSFAGDLSFRIICPNGQSVILDSYDNSGSAYLGQALDSDPCENNCSTTPTGCSQGTPWTYCWSSIYPQQGLLNNLDGGTSPVPATDLVNNTGYLTPEQPLSGLIGCPLNGTWSIEICDNWGIDDGWVFWWSLTLQNQNLTTGWSYSVPVDYVVWNSNGGTIGYINDTTAYFTTTQPGTYPINVIVYDVFGCSHSANFNVSVGGVTPPILGPDVSICSGQSVNLSAQGGNSYQWNTGQTTQTITVSPNQTTAYIVTVTAANNCTLSDTVVVNVIAVPSPTAGPDASVCSHSYTMQAQATVGVGQWSYTGPGTATFSNINNPLSQVSVTADGTYTFVWTENNNGCIGKDTMQITFTTMPTANAGTDITLCQLSTNLNAIPSVGTGTWTQISGPGTISFSNANDPNTQIVASTQGTYVLQWTENNGGNNCVSSDQVTVNLWNQPVANAGVLDSVCSLTYNLNAQPSVGQGTWSFLSGPGLASFSNPNSPVSSVNVTAYGTYNFIWTENNNNCISSDTVSIIFNYIPTSTFTISEINCFGDTATITFTGMSDNFATYNWNFGQANVISGSGAGPYQITFNSAGQFPISLTVSQHGCVSNPTIQMATNPPKLSIQLSKQDVSCFGAMDGKVYTAVSGGTLPYSFLWSNGMHSSFIANASGGIYSVTVTDAKGCKDSASVYINEPPKLFIDIPDTILACKDSVIQLSASVTGGTYPYSLIWNTGQHSQTINVSPQVSTMYSVSVYDANNCMAYDNTFVIIYPPLQLSYTTTNDSICPGTLFTIYPSASGGNGGPYTFYLNQQIQSNIPIHLYPNYSQSYQLTVKDGCNYTATVYVPVFIYPMPPISPTSDVVAGCAPLTVSFNDGSPDEGQSYFWQFGDGEGAYIRNPVHEYKEPGVYTVTLTVTNIYNCKVTNVYPNWIHVYPNPVARFIASPERANIIKPEIMFINYSSLADSVRWFFGDGDSSNIYHPYHIYNAVPGEYTVTLIVYTDKGCVDTAKYKVYIDEVYTFYAPTAFSPNNDLINDYFKVFATGIDYNTFKLQIFDRWGNIIWESNDINKEWDGKNKHGEMLPVGSYNWKATFRDYNNNFHIETGSVTIIR
ncbi:MAG: PKD domain-containing protein [Bacteroidales bacterium]|nr:PKD domain-containing protein [Bacteroidales bacterium]